MPPILQADLPLDLVGQHPDEREAQTVRGFEINIIRKTHTVVAHRKPDLSSLMGCRSISIRPPLLSGNAYLSAFVTSSFTMIPQGIARSTARST